jgi:hypothetical protein
MTYSTIIAKGSQHRGYRLRIAGVRYYFTSHPDVPDLTDPAGGALDFVRVEGAVIAPYPRTMPAKAHPLKPPEILTTGITLMDVDGRCTDIWGTEREYPKTVMTADLSAVAVSVGALMGPTATGLRAFDAAGLIYIDGEAIEYASINVGAGTINGLVRGKYYSDAVAHAASHLAGGMLAREVYNFLPHLWYREAVLEVFDLDTAHMATPDSATIARGFLQEPDYQDEKFVLRIVNYCHPLRRRVFSRSDIKGTLSRDFVPASRGVMGNSSGKGGFVPRIADPLDINPSDGLPRTESLYADPIGTPEIAGGDGFFAAADMIQSDDWAPYPIRYLLVGGDEGEIMGYSDWTGTTNGTPDDYFTIALRGCFGTPIGKDNEGSWPKGTPIQFICDLAGGPDYKTAGVGSTVSNRWQDFIEHRQYGPGEFAGVNAVDAFLMLLTSRLGDGSNGAWDVLPRYYGLGIDVARVNTTAFTTFKTMYCPTRNHVYLARKPEALLEIVATDLQLLYGGMVYATYEGQISIAAFRNKLPNSDVATITAAQILDFETLGIQEVFNSLDYTLDQWPSRQEGIVRAADYRRRDALGENAAAGATSQSLRGPGFDAVKKFRGDDVVHNQVTSMMHHFGRGAPAVQMRLPATFLDLLPGQFIEFTYTPGPNVTTGERGYTDQAAILIETEPIDEEAQIRVKAILLREYKTCLWAPSAEIDTRTSDTNFTIKAAAFGTDDRQREYWDVDTKIRVWNTAMTSFDDCTIGGYNPATGEINLSGLGSANVQDDNRITWSDWDTCRTGGNTQLERALAEEWYGFFCDSNRSLGAGDDPARVWAD